MRRSPSCRNGLSTRCTRYKPPYISCAELAGDLAHEANLRSRSARRQRRVAGSTRVTVRLVAALLGQAKQSGRLGLRDRRPARRPPVRGARHEAKADLQTKPRRAWEFALLDGVPRLGVDGQGAEQPRASAPKPAARIVPEGPHPRHQLDPDPLAQLIGGVTFFKPGRRGTRTVERIVPIEEDVPGPIVLPVASTGPGASSSSVDFPIRHGPRRLSCACARRFA